MWQRTAVHIRADRKQKAWQNGRLCCTFPRPIPKSDLLLPGRSHLLKVPQPHNSVTGQGTSIQNASGGILDSSHIMSGRKQSHGFRLHMAQESFCPSSPGSQHHLCSRQSLIAFLSLLSPEAVSLGNPTFYHSFFLSFREHCPQLPTIQYHKRHHLAYFVQLVSSGSRINLLIVNSSLLKQKPQTIYI